MKKRIYASRWDDPATLEDAARQCIEYPATKPLYGKMMSMQPSAIETWLSGVIDCAVALNRGDFDGLIYIYNRMLEVGVPTVRRELQQLAGRQEAEI